jgi:putative ABC transport system substrate-binding protein
MKRRDFLVAGGGAIAWPLASVAQDKMPTVGILALGNPDPVPFLKDLKEAMRDLGYVEGKTVRYEFRSADKKPANLAPQAAELVTLKPDVIVCYQTPAATAAAQAIKDIPIVMGGVGDPVGTGLVKSLARPGGNVTGVSAATAEMGAKNLELIREVLPSARRVAVLANAPDPFSKPFLDHIQAGAKVLNLEIAPIMVRNADELDADVAAASKAGAEAVIVQPSLPRAKVSALAITNKLPAFSPTAFFPEDGGLMSYSADQSAIYRNTAEFVHKILKGRKPADLPVEQPTKFTLVINLKTAKALGIAVPGTMLTRADQVIE